MKPISGAGRPFRIDGPPLIALAGLALIVVVAVWPTPPLQDGATIIASKQLRFENRAGGSLAVVDVATGRLAGVVPTVSEGFVPGVMHGMDVTRKRFGIDTARAYQLTEMTDGRVLLTDPSTRTEVDLESFGHGNAGSFVAFLHGRERPAR